MKVKKLLVLCQAYPDKVNPYQLMYAHTRNKGYSEEGVQVSVISFSAKKNYIHEDIKVYKENEMSHEQIAEFDLILCHAPNIRNHIRFIIRKVKSINIVFFIHGHEVLDVTKYYFGRYDDKEFSYVRMAYERLKLFLLRSFIRRNKKILSFIYVSKWMKHHFYKNIKLNNCIGNEAVINNGVNDIYLNNLWDQNAKKKYDFLTVRPLDEKKYAVDVVIQLANANPEKTFLLYGRGNIFDFISKPENIIHKDEFLHPKDMVHVLNQASCALMPTRLDAQGVMMCEMASYGIPIITSNIEICREMLASFDNAFFIDNAKPILPNLKKFKCISNNNTFSSKKLIEQEIKFFDEIK